jgi:uncharacterized protein (TIGR00251 family)
MVADRTWNGLPGHMKRTHYCGMRGQGCVVFIDRDNRSTDRGMMKKPFYTWDGDTLVLSILGTPNAKRDAIGKVKGHQLCVSVTAVPRAGRATDHMVRFLADEFDVPVSAIQVVSGRMNVNKQLRIKAPKRLPPVIGQQELFG